MLVNTMLDNIRIALYVALVAIALFLYQSWEREHTTAVATPQTNAAASVDANPNRFVPAPAINSETSAGGISQTAPHQPTNIAQPVPTIGKLIHVKTDNYDLNIDTLGGDIVDIKLLNYPESLGSPTPFTLLTDDPKSLYVAESGLLSKQGPDTSKSQGLYTADNSDYTLSADQNQLAVNLHWEKDGVKVTKTYTFTRGSYEIQVAYHIQNSSSQPWQGNFYNQLRRTDAPPTNHNGLVNLTTYFGAAIWSPNDHFKKISFKDMKGANLNQTIQGGWAAMIQHYFISAWIPDPSQQANFYSNVTANGNEKFAIGMMNPTLTVQPGATADTSAKLYSGPTSSDQLDKAAPGLKLTIDYRIFWFISGIIFWMMQKIYNVVGNWGWSIVLVTIIIKLMFYQLSAKSYRSMSSLKRLQPRMELLKERYADDKQKLTQATLELYKTEKVNPMSGCLPVLIQIPVFIALYWVLVESVELRQAPFIFWIHDLSQADPYYVLPVLMGISMFFQQRLNPPPPDPMQAKIMMFLPVIFTVLFANFPAGLMLYWFVNTSLSFLQQWYIMRKVNQEVNVKKA